MWSSRATLAALALTLPSVAGAHAQGFHKRLSLRVSSYSVEGVLAMDVDGGERCQGLRLGVDANRDGVLSDDEARRLKDKLVKLATQALALSFSSANVPVKVVSSKLSLREDKTVSTTGLSLAILLDATHPHEVMEGMKLEVKDSSPDGAPVHLEVDPAVDSDGGTTPVVAELEAGQVFSVRLSLGKRP